jgi:hypothetical protein
MTCQLFTRTCERALVIQIPNAINSGFRTNHDGDWQAMYCPLGQL